MSLEISQIEKVEKRGACKKPGKQKTFGACKNQENKIFAILLSRMMTISTIVDSHKDEV